MPKIGYRTPWFKIDPTAFVGEHIVSKRGKTTIVGWGCHIYGDVELGEGILIGPNVTINSSVHPIKPNINIKDQKTIHKKIIIEDHVFIGAGATVLGGNTVKSGAVIGAGSVLTEDHIIKENEVWCGNPCKFLKKR
ncbi:MAG: Transferase hexapeptide repeat containing protein [Candidatus Woesebacteria bacterium GW2011_GWA1_39_21]|uniref:Transferase hexapeptide repeat containing protein n=1 Tax=Candidatus Woesebacteria bacterium GW2011_GWA1_39_21 TaxID=1618550 RepID=A0A0G0RB70_9BACT|nr:MAG: Transferase hexapeptide repeat containing protein [Candidatus Woesebacteria bacterium GW2011_GWA1_39_21]